MSMDAHDGSLDGLTDLDSTEMADANRPYTEVTAEDLGTSEQIADGADPAEMVPDADLGVDTALHTDDMPGTETIDERLTQEQRDPASEVTYGADETGLDGELPGDADTTVEE